MANKIKKQTNGTMIIIMQLILFAIALCTFFTVVLPLICFVLIFVVGAMKRFEYRCSNCDHTTPENSKKCYTCGEEFR